jgi:curli production assembly/transport component CsgG
VLNPVTRINEKLRLLPPPAQRAAVAVYAYADQTGQFKPADAVQQLSRAVTQGATSVLIKALQDAGNGSWFMVVEREKLDNLLRERRIIADMRNLYLGERQVNPTALPPLLFAGILLEGGIIGYDSNTRTGGAGARYLGIGGDVQYREDTVTVYLRVVSTKTGEVLLSVVAHKTIISVALRGSAFKFVALDKILEAEAGFTNNEPEQIAVQQAIEKAVHTMIVEGSARNVWAFADKVYQSEAISKLDAEQALASRVDGRDANGAAPAAVAKAERPAPAVANARGATWQPTVTTNVVTPVKARASAPKAPAKLAAEMER